MITPSDEDYRETKLIKTGRRVLMPHFKELADWISGSFEGAHVLNVRYDKPNELMYRPRLSIVLECEQDKSKFQEGMNFDAAKQQRVAAKFREIVTNRRLSTFDLNGLFVVFNAFERVARIEANCRITSEQITQLKRALAKPEIWEIRPSWGVVVTFFHTEAQLKASEASPVRLQCAAEYAKILDAYDEFGYFRRRPIEMLFDSKQTFDSKYNGSWFNYDR